MSDPKDATTQEVVLAVDLGGTTIKGALVSTGGAPMSLLTQATTDRPQGNLQLLLALLDDLVDLARQVGQRPIGVGVVTPGLVDRDTGVVGYASNLGWRDVPVREQIRRRIELPVRVDHDVRAAGLAEAVVGRAQGVEHFVHVSIGTGVSAAIVMCGSPLIGDTHAAGELGHIPVYPAGERCLCGQRGCLEVYAAGAGIARRYRDRSGSPAAGAADVAARLGTDLLAAEIWAEAVEALSLGIATTTLLLDPSLVVIGGGLSQAGDALLDPLRVATARHLAWREPPALELSALGTSAGRVGASMLAMAAAHRFEETRVWTAAETLSILSPKPGVVPPA